MASHGIPLSSIATVTSRPAPTESMSTLVVASQDLATNDIASQINAFESRLGLTPCP